MLFHKYPRPVPKEGLTRLGLARLPVCTCLPHSPLFALTPQGAFADTVRMLFAKRFGTTEPEIEVFGKPTKSTFDYARLLLETRAMEIGGEINDSEIETVYMVGGEWDPPGG